LPGRGDWHGAGSREGAVAGAEEDSALQGLAGRALRVAEEDQVHLLDHLLGQGGKLGLVAQGHQGPQGAVEGVGPVPASEASPERASRTLETFSLLRQVPSRAARAWMASRRV